MLLYKSGFRHRENTNAIEKRGFELYIADVKTFIFRGEIVLPLQLWLMFSFVL